MQFPEFGPEKITEALASFPPKLSVAAELLAEPEKLFEEQASAMGIPVPAGPARTLAQALSGIEATLPAFTPPAFTPPGFPAPTAPTTPTPTAPTAPPAGGAGQGVSLGEVEKVEIERPSRTRTRERIEIVEA